MALPDHTEDGFDVQMQTNHLSHFLLTCELLPLLEKAANDSGEARIVNHSSIARMNPKNNCWPSTWKKYGGNWEGTVPVCSWEEHVGYDTIKQNWPIVLLLQLFITNYRTRLKDQSIGCTSRLGKYRLASHFS